MKIVCILLSGLTSLAGAEPDDVKTVWGTAYISAKYLGIQVDDTVAQISDPGIFEGKHALEFEPGNGFGLELGVSGDTKYYFFGMSFELLFNSSDLSAPLPEGTIYDGLNTLEQRSINLNMMLGTELSNRVRPYCLGGIGYTESELVGNYGLALTSLEDGWDSTFTYHFGAGVDVRLVKSLYLNLGYRFYDAGDPETNTRGRTIAYTNSGQMFHIGLSWIHKFKPIEYTTYQDIWEKRNQWKIQ